MKPWATWLLIAANVVVFLLAPDPAPAVLAHEAWPNLAVTTLFLLVSGRAVEDRFGPFRFLVFYLLCGYASVRGGAAGAVSGVLGAYLVLHPRARALPAWPLIGGWFAAQWMLEPEYAGYAVLGFVVGMFATLPLLRRRPLLSYQRARAVTSRSSGGYADAGGSGRGSGSARGTGSGRGSGGAAGGSRASAGGA